MAAVSPLRLLGETFPEGDQDDRRLSEIEAVFAAASGRRLPRNRALKSWEPAKMNQRHLQMVMMRAAGAKQCEIAEALGTSDSSVSIALNHPDAQFMLTRLASLQAVDATDARSRMREMLEPALDAIEEVLSDPEVKPEVRARVGFAVFDRNFGKTLTVDGEVKHTHQFNPSPEKASSLALALRESMELQHPQYRVLPEEVPGGAGEEGAMPSEPDSQDTGAPPTSGPQEPSGGPNA